MSNNEEINELTEKVIDMTTVLFEIQAMLGAVQLSLADQSVPEQTPATPAVNFNIAPLLTLVENEIQKGFNKIQRQMLEMQVRDTTEIVEQLNDKLEVFSGIVANQNTIIEKFIKSNDLVFEMFQKEMTRILAPMIGNLLLSMRKEIVRENQLALEKLTKEILSQRSGF